MTDFVESVAPSTRGATTDLSKKWDYKMTIVIAPEFCKDMSHLRKCHDQHVLMITISTSGRGEGNAALGHLHAERSPEMFPVLRDEERCHTSVEERPLGH